jgi:hypothetical protein
MTKAKKAEDIEESKERENFKAEESGTQLRVPNNPR